MGGADVKRTEGVADKQGVLGDWQFGQGQDWMARAVEDRDVSRGIYSELLPLASDLMSGNTQQMTRAAAPALRNISTGYAQARGQADLNPARGAASDFYKMQLDSQQADATAQALGQGWMKGIDLSQRLGMDFSGMSLNESGLSSRLTEGAATTTAQQSQTERTIMQAENAKKQARMGLIGDAIGAFAGPLTGGISSIFSKKDPDGGGATPQAGYGVGDVMTTAPAPQSAWTPPPLSQAQPWSPSSWQSSQPLSPVWQQQPVQMEF